MNKPDTPAIIIESQYFPSVAYLSLFTTDFELKLEQFENYQKSSYRNRCIILGSNGPLTLSIPLDKGKHQQTPIKAVGISYTTAWHQNHFKAIQSAYGKAPFYIHYIDEIESIYREPGALLWDFNLRILKFLLKSFQISKPINFTEDYQRDYPSDYDFRGRIKPGIGSSLTGSVEYEQVFTDKFGFTAGMSALDLLMCQGPYGKEVLRKPSAF